MVISKRYLSRLGLIIFLPAFSVSDGLCQNPEPQPPMFRVVAVGNTVPLTDLLYEHQGKSLKIYPSDVSLSAPFQRPSSSPLELYREAAPIPPETKPKRVSLFKANLDKEPLSLLVLSATNNNQVSCTVIDDSWETFPVQTVRVLNFSRRKVVTQIEGTVAEIPPSGIHLFPYSTTKLRISCKVASKEEDGWKLQFSNSQSIVQGRRVNIMISDCEPHPLDPTPDGINVLKMIDPLLPPKPEN